MLASENFADKGNSHILFIPDSEHSVCHFL
jgi:hypothetical protein